MNDNPTPKTIAEAEAVAARYGITITPQDYADMQLVIDERRRQIESESAAAGKRTGAAAFVDSFNRWYPKFLQTLLGIGDVLITGTHTVLIAFGVPVVLLMLLIVEQQRVSSGIEIFEVHQALATFGAAVVVILNLLLELLINWNEHRTGYAEPQRHEFSLRLWAARLMYILGRQKEWRPRPKSPAHRERNALKIVTGAILVLALLGSMQGVIANVNSDWLSGIVTIITKSTLLQMATWLGGLLFAFAAVISAQTLSRYVAQKVVEVVAIMQSSANNKPELVAEALGVTAATFLATRIKDHQRERRISATAPAANMPSVGMSGVYKLSPVSHVSSISDTPDTSTKRSPVLQKAIQWINDHPESAALSINKAAKAADVSHATMQRARDVIKM